MDVPAVLRAARREAGLSQAALAARAGTSQAAISAYESGAKSPSPAVLDRILRATGRRLAVTGAGDGPSRAEQLELARKLSDVLSLAEALPSRHSPELSYPPLSGRTRPQ